MSADPTAPRPVARELELPWDEQAERAVLGAVLLDPRALDPASELLTAEDFHRPAHRYIFGAFLALAQRNEIIEPVTVRVELERRRELERAGGAAYVMSLIDGLPRTSNVPAYARIVRDNALRRKLCEVGQRVRDRATEPAGSALEIIEEAEREIFSLAERGHTGGFQPIQQIADAGLEKLEELSERRELITGLATGYVRLDRMTSGLQPGELLILAARPSMGKTALALNIAQHVALHGGATVGVFSLEMAAQQLFFRLLAGEGRIDSHKLRTGRLSSDEWERVTHTFDLLANAPVFIDDTPGATPMEIRSKARRLKSEHDLGLLVIDYLQLMQADRGRDSRQQEISEISRALKGIAKELDIPVIALSQLSRAPDQRTGDHRPQLSDLRESGAIEQDADLVMFIYRPEVYEKDEAKIAEKELEGKAEIIVAKQRNGPIGIVPLYFVKEFTRFENRDDFGIS
jgi:replicative DNA helicase